MMDIEKIDDNEKITLINKQVSRYIKFGGLYGEVASIARTIGLTEGWVQLHKDLPKQYSAKEVYNAIQRGCTKFLLNEYNGVTLSNDARKKLKKAGGNVELDSYDPLRRTEWGHLDVKIKNPCHSIGWNKPLLKRLLGALRAKDKKVFILMYGDLMRGVGKRKTYKVVADKIGISIRTVQTANRRIEEAIKEVYLKGE